MMQHLEKLQLDNLKMTLIEFENSSRPTGREKEHDLIAFQ